MLRSLLEWNRQRKEWNAKHVAAWVGATTRGADGFTALQRLCEAQLSSALAAIDTSLTDRDIADPSTSPWIRARIEGTALNIWLHDDTVGLDGHGKHSRFEEWDFETPEDLASAFTAAVIAAVRTDPAGAV